MEMKLKQIVLEWKKTEDKDHVIQQMKNLLFKKKDTVQNKKAKQKTLAAYTEMQCEINIGSQVKLKNNYQVGTVLEIRKKRAIVQVGMLPLNVAIEDLVPVKKRENIWPY